MDSILPFPISRTKIISPQHRAEIITRPRLIEMLLGLLNKKLTLISAPAGYGKTTLLVDLVEKSEIPICWLSLDILDQEPQRFLSYLIACIREKFPAFGAESLAVLNNAASIEKENERLAVISTNEIYHSIHEHFAIVLDDYQFIEPVAEIRLFINRFIQLAGEHCHLILASRTLPTLADLHLLVAREQVGGLSLEDLAFLPDEIQVLFAQNSAKTLSLDEAEELARKTDGWITSISLSGLSLDRGRNQPGHPSTQTGVNLYEYFSREVLAKQAPDVREFLLLTSFFDEVDIDLCCAVLEPLFPDHLNNWRALFNIIQNNNLFVIPVGAEGLTYRYHHLFQDYLQAKLTEENPSIICVLMNQLAYFYTEKHDWEKAHHIYESINNLTALVALIEEAGTYYIRNGRVATLGSWLDRLPFFLLLDNPKLLSLQGAVAHIRGETQTGLSLLNQAEKGFRENPDNENLAVTLVRRAAAYRETGDYAVALADAEEAIDLTQNNENSNLQYNLAAAMRVKGMALFSLGQTVEAQKWFESSLNLFSLLQDKDYIPILEMELGTMHHALGNNEIAIRLYLSAVKSWEGTGNLGWQASLLNNLGVLYHQIGEYEKAFRTFEHAIDCANRSGYMRTQAMTLCSMGDLLIDVHEIKHSIECFEQALNIASQHEYSFLFFYASVARARAARLENKFELAETLLQDLLIHIQHNVSPGEDAIFRMENGCLLLSTNKPHLAANELTQAVNIYKNDGRILETNIGYLWLSASFIASGQIDSATLQLKELVAGAAELNELVPLQVAAKQIRHRFDKVNFPAEISATLQRIFTGAEHFTRKIPALRRKLRQISESAFISPPHLTIRAFGPAEVSVSGKKIMLSDWQTRETRELFFYFLYSGSQTKEDIAGVFWPDISPARLKMRFKTNMYRLRHAVGQNSILFEDERYFFNREIDYDYDVENFKKFLEQARSTTHTDERKNSLKAAIELVEGPYLADVDAEWADLERSRFQHQYHAALIRLAEVYLDDNQAAEALSICQTALKSDILMEEAYRLSMRAYAILEDGAAVARVFQTCSVILEDELGVKPSRETRNLYQKLI